jgi:hypothetical protein
MGPKKRKRKYKSPLTDLGAFRHYVITGKVPRGWKFNKDVMKKLVRED